MPFKFVVEDSSGGPRDLPLPVGVHVLGRWRGCDLHLDAPLMSRRHAKVVVKPDTLEVFDLDSHNGVFVNGQKIRQSTLGLGDALYLGSRKLVVAHHDDSGIDIDPQSNLHRASQTPEWIRALDALGSSDLDLARESADPDLQRLSLMLLISELRQTVVERDIFLQDVVDLISDRLQAGTAALLLGKKASDLRPVAFHRRGVSGEDDEVPVSWPVAQQVYDQGEALFSKDQPADPILVSGIFNRIGDSAVLCTPVVDSGGLAGCFFVTRPFAEKGFSLSEVEWLVCVGYGLARVLRREIPPSVDSDGRTDVSGQSSQETHLHRSELAQRVRKTTQEKPIEGPRVFPSTAVVVWAEVSGLEHSTLGAASADAQDFFDRFYRQAHQLSDDLSGSLELAPGGGVLVLFEGDGSDAAKRALDCAVRLAATAPPATATALGVRVGIDQGSVHAGIFDEGHIFSLIGSAPRRAQRVADIAQTRQVVATAELRLLLSDRSGVQAVALGPHAIRGQARPIELFLMDVPQIGGGGPVK